MSSSLHRMTHFWNLHFAACPEGQFQCANGPCIPIENWCNGVMECADGSDEDKCVTELSEFLSWETISQDAQVSLACRLPEWSYKVSWGRHCCSPGVHCT